MNPFITRRGLLMSGAAMAGAAGLGLPAFAQSDTRLRMYWWGGKERADRTEATNKLFVEKNAGTTITGETLGWNDYWQRLATQIAGRNGPDLIQMDYRYIFEYARRDALLAMDPFIGKGLNLADFNQGAVDSGKVDGKIYGVSLGLNSVALFYSQDAIRDAGMKPPAWDLTWEGYAKYALDLTKALKRDGFWGMQDAGGLEPALDNYMRGKGLALYTADGKLGFAEKDIAGWFGYWADLRKAGGCPPADVQALDKNNPETNMLTLGKAAIGLANSNQLVAYQAINKPRLGIGMFPKGEKPGQYLKPSMLLSVYSRTKNPEAAMKVVDFYINNPDAGKLLGLERGVPASAKVRDALASSLNELDRMMSDYIAFISDKVGDLPPPPPQGAGEIQNVLRRINEQIGFGRMSVADGAKQFMSDANGVLARG